MAVPTPVRQGIAADDGQAGLAKATFGGGCFWCTEAVYAELKGVKSVTSGYTNGTVPNPTYKDVCTGLTGHAEAIEIVFDPERATYRDLLEFFFQIHDPSTPGRQGNDRGSSYRSAIFYTSDEQLATAQQTIADVNASGLWPGKVVTELAPAGPFWEAEPEHQDYLVKHPNGYTCHYPRAGWKLPRREIG